MIDYTGSMNYARTRHEAVLLPDNTVFVIGGYSAGTNQHGHVERFFPAQMRWYDMGDFPGLADVGMTATLLPDNTVLVTGGRKAATDQVSQEVWRYRPFSNTWERMTDLISPRSYYSAVVIGKGRVLLISSDNVSYYSQVTGDAEIYDPFTGIHGSSARSGGAIFTPGFVATSLRNGNVLVTGGTYTCYDIYNIPLCGTVSVQSAVVFNTADNAWAPLSNMTAARAYHTATLLSSDAVLIVGGQSYLNGYLILVWTVHSAAEVWNAPAPSSCGEVIDIYKGVPARYNGALHGSLKSCGNGGKYGDGSQASLFAMDGLQWQCVEFVRRFYRIAMGCTAGVPCDSTLWQGKANAKDFFAPRIAELFKLSRYPNCWKVDVSTCDTATTAPQVDDIVVFCRLKLDGTCEQGNVGHVAIVREVDDSGGDTFGVRLIEQNWDVSASATLENITMVVVTRNANGTYSMQKRGKYTALGWLRKR